MGTAPGILGVASSGFGVDFGHKSMNPGRILEIYRGPFSLAEFGEQLPGFGRATSFCTDLSGSRVNFER